MHADGLCDISKLQRLQGDRTVVEECAMAGNDSLGNLLDRLQTLRNVLQRPARLAKLVAQFRAFGAVLLDDMDSLTTWT